MGEKVKDNEKTGVNRNWLYQIFLSSLSRPDRTRERVEKAKNVVNDQGKKYNEVAVAEYLIEHKARATALVGGATAFPGTIPGIGAVGTITTAISSEIVAVTKLEIELCLEIACLYGWDISDESRVWEITGILNGQGRRPAQEEEVLRRMIARAVKTGMIRVMIRVSRRIGLRMLRRLIIKVLPWVGIPIGAGYNMMSTREIGRAAHAFYGKQKNKKRKG